MKKRWFCMLLAVLMLCALVGCNATDTTQDAGDDTPTPTTTTTTTTTQQAVAPIELVEGEIPSDCYWQEDASCPTRNVAVMIKANVNLVDVRWLALNPDPPTVDRVLYNRSLNKDEIWAINTYINDAVPNRGVTCVDESGKTYYYAISYLLKGDGSPSLGLTPLNVEALSATKLDELETYLNDIENNGFLSMNEYTCPEEVSLASVLYDGAGFGEHSTEWAEEERQDFLAVREWEEFYVGALRFPRTDVEALIQKKLGIPLTELDLERSLDHGLHYSEKFDVFYNAHSDSQYQAIEVIDGWLDGGEGGLFIVDYKIGHMGDTGRVTLRLTKDGYQFVSNSIE